MDSADCCFQRGDRWFRYRATAVIIEGGYVLMARNDRDPFYYAVGGGVRIGEAAADAVRREVREEVGKDYEIDRLAFIHENFFIGEFPSNRGLKCHELALYFLMKPLGTRDIRDTKSRAIDGAREHMHWLPVDRLGEYFIRPEFLRDKIRSIGDAPEHIVTHQR
jgi:ADP-ribose pyrophosphatase YjhB (NUDIX family)